MASDSGAPLAKLAEAFVKSRGKNSNSGESDSRDGGRDGGVSGTLPKPDEQIIKDDKIQWFWNHPKLDFHINATYFRASAAWEIRMYGDDSRNELVGSTMATWIAEALLSAVQWEYIWQANVGQFLVKDISADDISADDDSFVIEEVNE